MDIDLNKATMEELYKTKANVLESMLMLNGKAQQLQMVLEQTNQEIAKRSEKKADEPEPKQD